MNKGISYYTKYREHITDYNDWNSKNSGVSNSSFSQNNETLKQKAKAIAEPILLLDSYTHEKAEDSETFYQTYNTELMSVTSLACTLPILLDKFTGFINDNYPNVSWLKNLGDKIESFSSKTIKILGKNIKTVNLASTGMIVAAGVFFWQGIKKSVESQLGLVRKASFDATQSITDNPKMFAVLTPEQENELNSIVNHNANHQTAFVDKLKDKIDISSSFQSVENYNRTKADYLKKKSEYFENINTIPNKTLSSTRKKQAEEDKQLFHNLLKNVEHDVLEPLRKVETIANISYSALFAGGFLEYLLTHKVVELMKVKNPLLKVGLKIGVPLISYLLLNKNISDFENKAILATKYKHLKQFMENPSQYERASEQKQTLPQFIKTIAQDMKDYDTFAEKELPKIKERLEAKKQINISLQQEKDAKLLQKNTTTTVNTLKERMLEQTVGIEALSEIISNPIDIAGAAVGGVIGNKLANKVANKKLKVLMTLLGTAIGFVPVAIMEAKFTNEQKKAEKIATMLAMKDLNDARKFADYSEEQIAFKHSDTFKDFIKV